MTPSQPRIGQINAKLTCDFFIPNSYERQSDAPPHVRASPCAAAAWIDLKFCRAAICEFRQQIHAFARREEDGKTVNGQGADTDTLVASARAYINALNKLLVKRQKTAPAAMSA